MTLIPMQVTDDAGRIPAERIRIVGGRFTEEVEARLRIDIKKNEAGDRLAQLVTGALYIGPASATELEAIELPDTLPPALFKGVTVDLGEWLAMENDDDIVTRPLEHFQDCIVLDEESDSGRCPCGQRD